MKQEIKPATGRLGVLVVGVGGAVATTMIVGTLASRKGLAKPIGIYYTVSHNAHGKQRRKTHQGRCALD